MAKAAYGNETAGLDSGMKELLQLLRGLSCGVLAVLLFGWVIMRIRVLDSKFDLQIPSSAQTPGAVMMSMGAILVLVCIAVFGLWGTGTPSLLAPTSQLVTLGPYRYVRNPIHVGQVIFLVGLGLYLRSIAVLLFALTWLLFCHLYVVLIEEGSLKRKFGAPYEEYCKAVPRWLPSAPFREKV